MRVIAGIVHFTFNGRERVQQSQVVPQLMGNRRDDVVGIDGVFLLPFIDVFIVDDTPPGCGSVGIVIGGIGGL